MLNNIQLRHRICLVHDNNTRLYNLLLTDGDCNPEPEKSLSTPISLQQELCRIQAYATYLSAILDCEGEPNQEACCKAAYQDYCTTVEQC